MHNLNTILNTIKNHQRLRQRLLCCVVTLIATLSLYTSGVALALTADNQSNSIKSASTVTQGENDTLVVGSEQDYPPFATGLTDATAGGFTVELWKAVAAETGLKYSIRVRPFHELVNEFKTGKIDVLINLAISDERNTFADFSVPHAIVHGGIFVRNDESNITSEADFAGKSIIVLNGDLAHNYAVSRGWAKQLVLVDTAAEGLRLLASGKHDAMLIGKLVGMQTLEALALNNIKVLKAHAGFSQKFAIAVHEGHSELLGKINEGLALNKANGTYDALYEKWLGIYEPKELGLRDILKYLSPFLLLFLGLAQYGIYRRNLERKTAQKALQESEAHLRLSQTSGGIGTWEADLVNHTQKWSENCTSLLGFTATKNPTWDDFVALVHPQDRQYVIDATQAHIEQGTPYDVEYRIITPAEECRWIRSTGQVERDATGKPIIMRGISQDVQVRKLTEQNLQKSEHTLSKVLENVDAYIYLKDRQNRYLYANAKVCALFGTTLDAIVGRGDEQFFDAETTEKIRLNDNQVLLEGKTVKTEDTNVTLINAVPVTYLSVKLPLRNDAGEIYALCGISTEITDIKRVQQTLQKSEARLASLFSNMTNGFALHKVIRDTSGQVIDYRFLDVNPAFEAMTGIPCEQWIGQRVKEVLPSVEEDFWIDSYAQVVNTGEPAIFEKHSHELGRWFRIHAYRPAAEHFAVIVEDITEHKLAEEKLIKSEGFSRAIIEASPVPFALNDDYGNITYLNNAFINTFGYNLSNIPTLTDWWSLAYPDPEYRQQIIDNWRKNLKEAQRTKTPFQPLEINIQCKDGSLRTSICTTTDVEGDFTGTHLVSLVDITERKVAEDRQLQLQAQLQTQNENLRQTQTMLQETRDRYIDLYEFAPIGYLAISNHGIISEINWKATGFFGLHRNELNGHRFEEFVADDEKQRWQRMFSSTRNLISGEDSNFDLKITHKDGTVLDVNLTCLRMDDDADEPMLRISMLNVTQLKLAETKLINSEAYLRKIIENEPECIKVVDAKCNLKQMNPAGLAMLEAKTFEQAASIPLIDFIAPEYQKAFLDLHSRVIAGESMQLQFEVIGFKGRRRWMETHAVPLKENGAKFHLAVTNDITERKLAEKRIEILLAEQTTMLDNKLVGIAKVRDRKIVWSNIAFELIHGYSHEELIGMPTRQLYLDEETYQAVGASYAKIKKHGVTRGQYEFVRKDGQTIWLNMSGAMLNKDEGESIWTFVDVTSQKQAELAAAAAHNLLETVIDKAPVRIFWKDKDLRYLGCNTIFANDAGKASALDIIGKNDFELSWAALAELYQADDRAVIASGVAKLGYDEPQTTPQGDTIWLRTSKIPLMNNQNEVFGILGMYEDITERKLAKNELRIAAIAFESQEGMLVTDANNVILKVNQAFSAITGYSAEEVIGQRPSLLSSGKHDADFYKTMWKGINDNGTWQGEIWNKRKSGEVYPEQLCVTAVKDIHGVITNYVATLTDITMNKAAAEEIQRLAFYDPLTQLPNRRLLVDRLNQAIVSSARNGVGGAVLFMDLDHFKTLNDSLGHDIGDLMLQQVAERLISCVREGDTVARLGGDEYVVMLEHLSTQAIEAAAQAEGVAEKILTALNKPFKLAAHEYQNTASIGIALFNDQSQSQEDLLKYADIAMYQAKKSGRNALCFFDPKMQEAIRTRVSLEGDLRKALEKKEFQLHYQIQVNGDGQALGAEALIRWVHPTRGLVSPYHFIPLAEDTGLILPIGQWVLETACAQLKAWEQNPLTRDLTLSINVSAKQFNQADFVKQVQATVQLYEINPGLLNLELTESIIIDNIDHIIITMIALQTLGVHFELDDFGTGYSSLQYLKQLPLHQLKIDQSFVRDIIEDISDQAIIRTIIAMARSLNLEVIAEGVETEDQLAYLANYGCNHFQGYLFGKPVPIEVFEAALKKD